MPEFAADLSERLRHVEQAIRVHEAQCEERNKNLDRWTRNTDHNVKVVSSEVNKLKLSDARRMGYFAGAAAVGGLVGAIAPHMVEFLKAFAR